MTGDPWEVKRTPSLPWERLEAMIQESRGEGFRFLDRLSDEWHSGANRFDKDHEAVFLAVKGTAIVGVCGLNVDPYQADPRVARLRHMYVRPTVRRNGAGSELLRGVLDHATSSRAFDSVRLRTEFPNAARFYEARGFRRCLGDGAVTHVLEIRTGETGPSRVTAG